VELAAVAMVPAREDLMSIHEAQPHALATSENSRPFYSPRMPILGNDILRSWMDRIRKLGLRSLWLTSSPREESVDGSGLDGSAQAEFARQGVERLLVIQLKAYAEMDLADLLLFHCESRNPVTEAEDARGQLGVCLRDHLALHAKGEQYAFASAPPDRGQTPYQFRGYAKRILSARERQELVGDGLTGACAMRPLGTEIRDQVWVGEGANLADSARVIGPTYIGARTIVHAGATIGPFASVEHDCVVDCGTTVERSTILPHTYLAPGLLIRHQLVDGGYLEDLSWGAVADLRPAGLGRRIQRRESRRQAFHETDVLSRAGRASTRHFAASSTASQPWLRIEL
jgi:carbonic anhydrase/acetyltransferase-like protein (isoleucine patch superfamily)